MLCFKKRALAILLAVMMVVTIVPVQVSAATTESTIITGLTYTDSLGVGSLSGTTLTFSFGGFFNTKENTIKFYNRSGSVADFSFSYSYSGTNGTFTVNGVKEPGSPYSIRMNANDVVTITVSSNGMSTAKITMNGFALTPVVGEANVTVAYDAELGTVTNGETTVPSSTATDINVSSGLKATPANGASFVGWMNTDGTLYSSDTSIMPEENTTVAYTAVFATTPWFLGGNQLFDNWSDAFNSNYSTLVLMNNATLPAGEYEIPSGKTLLIPYDDAHTLCTTQPTRVKIEKDANYTTPTAYRTLTMAEGAHITVNGAMSLSAQQAAGTTNITPGAPTGPVSFVKMNSESTITVNSDAKLYAWGYITGSGSVTAKSGAAVYEDFQVTDWRGGTATSSMANNAQGVFPMSQYYVQNIEVPLTLESGASEICYMSVTITLFGIQGSAVPFIGDGGMFQINSGSVTKDYDESTDRLVLDVNGDVSMSSISLSMQLGLGGATTLDSARYNLPINSNITVKVNRGTINITQDIALLPDAEIYVGPNAVCSVASGSEIYVYDLTAWQTDKYCYSNANLKTLGFAPGRTCSTRTLKGDASVVIEGILNAYEGFIYGTSAGYASISGNPGGVVVVKAGAEKSTYQATQGGSEGKEIFYNEILINPIKLKNANGTLVDTADCEEETRFTYINGEWVNCTHPKLGSPCAGYEAGDCPDCKETVEAAAPSHTPSELDAVAPTCTEPGLEKGSCCAICGAILEEQKELDPLGHAEEIIPANAATCTQNGNTAGTKCARCEEILKETEVIDATGHTEESILAAEPTCTNPGLTAGSKCSVCGEVITKQEVIPALGHDYKAVTTAATCTADGSIDHTCSRCNDTYTETISATGHDLSVEVSKEATCQEAGEKKITCSRCDFSAQEAIAVLPHTEEIIPGKAATCTETGLTEGKRCSVCQTILTAQAVVPVLGHTSEEIPAVDATCTETGLTVGYKCSVCGEIITDQEEVPALGHSLDEGVVTTDATCVAKGVKTYTCSVCNETETEEIPVDSTKHAKIEVIPAVAATCEGTGLTAGSKCTVCDTVITEQEKTPATGHNYDDGVVTIYSNCTESGVRTYTCTNGCGGSYTEEIPSLGHSSEPVPGQAATCTESGLTEGSVCSRCKKVLTAQEEIPKLGHDYADEVTTAPTCEEKGVRTYTCSVCGNTYTEEIAPTGHTEEEIPAVAPTCTEEGSTAGAKCSVCGEILTAPKTIPSSGHTEETVAGKDATCTATGLTDGVKCSVCGEILTAQEELEMIPHDWNEGEITTVPTCTADGMKTFICTVCSVKSLENVSQLGHDIVTDAAVDPTCTESGLTEGFHCSRCDYKVAQKDVEALGHDFSVDIPGKLQTCTEDGLTATKKCSRCEELEQKQEEIPADGHTWDKGTDNTATCTKAGTALFTCSVCGEEETRPTEALDHDFEYTAAKEPTCTEVGEASSSVCKREDCGFTTGGTEIPALGHNYKVDTKEATCTEDGLETSTCKREGCNDVTTKDLPKLGHDLQEIEEKTVPATCTVDGSITYECSRFDYTSTETITAPGHTKETVSGKAATCLEAGLTDGVKCSVCGETLTEQEEIPATGHTKEAVPGKAATCVDYGLSDGVRCSVCNETLTAREKIEPLGHDYNEGVVTKEATCTEAGIKTFTCEREGCGDSYPEEVAMLEHDYEEAITTAATCTEAGEKTFTCSVCGVFYTEAIAMLGHTPVTVPAKDATCTAAGLTEGSKCSVCGIELKAQEVIPMAAHEYDDGVVETEATCTATGLKIYTCGSCKDKKEEVLPKIDHNYVEVPGKAPTCTEIGLTTGSACSVCGDIKVPQIERDKIDHKYGTEGVVTKDATCKETGVRTYTCTMCKIATTTTEIPMIPHTPVDDPAVAATCTTAGYTDGSHCGVCEEILREQTVIPATGHKYGSVVTQAATCTVDGIRTYTCSKCNDSYTKGITATGHTEKDIPAVAATCTAEGSEGGKYCTVCSQTTVEPQPVEKLAHKETTIPGKASTCTEDGLTEGKMCTVCQTTTVAQTMIPHEGHKPIEIPAVAPTCTKDGTTAGEKCSVCSEVLKAPETDPMKGHTYEAIAAVAPTCTESGLTEGQKCSVCDALLVPQTIQSALGHDYIVDAKQSATCTEPGLTEGKHCSRCDDKVAQEVISALGHVSVTDKAVAPTCTEPGFTEGSHCSRCNAVLTAQAEIPATNHDMSAATCTKPAICKYNCGYTEGEALGHDEVECEEVFALCESAGMTAGVRCRRCGQVLSGLQELKPLGHDYITVPAKRPTFTSVGWEEYTKCSRCAYSTYVEIPMLESDGIKDYETFIENLEILEDLAGQFVKTNPGKDPAALVIKYIRTGVDRYNSGSWGIMAGYEDTAFAEFVAAYEDEYNSNLDNVEDMMHVTALKNIENFDLPNGDYADIGHVFGTMDITYHNKFGLNHADVAGWAGDTVDLISLSDQFGVDQTADFEALVKEITDNYFLKSDFPEEPIEGTFSYTDFLGDLDGFYIMKTLEQTNYKPGTLTAIFEDYFTEDLTDEDRAAYFIDNRMNGVSLRSVLREEVYNTYIANKVVSTLEGTRVFNTDDLTTLRKACCYAFADYICKLAGDYVEITENKYFTVFSDESSILAPGITQQKKLATTADNKQVAFYIATADLTRDDVDVYANYHDNDPAAGWEMQRVLDQANAAQSRYGDPDSEYYIENYNVITSINGDGYNMSTGEPGGLLVMNGIEYHPIDNGGFFGILKDGTAMIGTQAEYNALKDQVQEGIGGFGTMLIKDGKIAVTASGSYYTDRASRTAVGITATGKVVFLVVDGRQEPWSCGGSMAEIAQMMFEAGCVNAVNLDGGGSTTYVAKEEGMDELAVVSSPSDGYARSVSTSLMMVSTAPSSTAFDHAVISTDYDYLTVDSVINASAKGVSATGNTADLPEDAYWTVSDSRIAEITEDGVLTGKALGEVNIQLMQGDTILAFKTVEVVIPDNIYFSRSNINAVYGAKVELPVKAVYDSNPVSINESDVTFTLSIPEAGYTDGFTFIGNAESNVKTVKVIGELTDNPGVAAAISVSLFKQGEAAFDFDQATGGDRQLAWDRKVSNSTTEDAFTYFAVDPDEDMVTSYTFAIDMEKIEIPPQIADLTYMLPGADDQNASAWTFLCQLAQRISDLTEVRPVIRFDDDVEVDYSNITLVNEYFTLSETIFDEDTNTLTLVLNWKRQTQAIDPDYANPICILSGVKLTPRDGAAWDKDQLAIVNSGEISYAVYMRASALYTFAQNPANQAQFGLKPYTHPTLEEDKGGYLENIYKKFEDSYRLNKSSKNGWVVEDGGFAYYEDGERYTGIREIDGYYYDFGENGINIGQTKYTGWIKDAAGERYAKVGVIQIGWQQIGDTMYHCHNDGYAHSVTVNDPVTCIKGGRRSYVCDTCGDTEKSNSYTMPQGHVWNADHICTVCRFKGIDISEGGPVTINFGTIDNPRTATDIPRYVYKSSGVRPATYATLDGKKALTQSSDATLNSNGTMRDLYVTWSDNNGVGYGKINFVGKGNYYGERTLIFKIIPGDATNLRAAKVTMYTATLAWDAAPAADFYRVYQCASNGANPKLIGTTEDTTFKIEGLTPSATTYYKVACSAYVEGEAPFTNANWSNVLAVTANESDPAEAVIDNITITTDEAVCDMIINGDGYFMILPGNADSAEISIDVDGSDADIIVSGDLGEVTLTAPDYTASISIDDLATIKDGKGTIDIKIGAYSAMKITVYKTTELAELYIVSDDPDNEGRDFVDESKSNETTGSVTLISEDGTVTYEGNLSQIKARGNSTFNYYNKKAYQIKLDPKGDLLENGESVKTWILLANYADATLMHDKLTKDLAAALDMEYTASCDWVNLYYDGEYRGVYLLSEKNSISSTSVDITDMEEAYEELNPGYGDNMSVGISRNKYDQEFQYTEGLTDPADITGGYLIELHHSDWDEVSGFDTKQGVSFNVKSPEWCSENAMLYISEYYQEFEDAVYAVDANGNYTGINPDTGLHYYDYVDKDSLVKVFILQQFNRNPDGFTSSMYFYKDAGEIMYCGPIWDQDVTYGTGWAGTINSTGTSYHYLEEALIKIPDFEEAVIEAYNSEVAPLLDELIKKNGIIDEYYDRLDESAEMNYLLWPYVRVGDPDASNHLWTEGTDYDTVVEDLKDWIESRIDVLDDKWGTGETYILGDVNNDGKVGIGDVVLIRRYLVGYNDSNAILEYGDVNMDGKVSIGDVVLIRRYLVGYNDRNDIGKECRS